jgi:hypothetical protein
MNFDCKVLLARYCIFKPPGKFSPSFVGGTEWCVLSGIFFFRTVDEHLAVEKREIPTTGLCHDILKREKGIECAHRI